MDGILQKHAPIKKRYVRANQALFINNKISKLSKVIIIKTLFRNKFMDSETDAGSIVYNKQRKYCIKEDLH